MKPLQRAQITDCPHDGKHTGRLGYVVDTYPDGTSSVDMGHNICCITAGWEPIDPVRREDLKVNDDGLVDEPVSTHMVAPPKKRRGRPPKAKAVDNTKPIVETRPRPVPTQSSSLDSPQSNILVVSSIEGSRVSMVYQGGSTRIELTAASAEDMERISAILDSLTTGTHD